jgi:hypothetical protein
MLEMTLWRNVDGWVLLPSRISSMPSLRILFSIVSSLALHACALTQPEAPPLAANRLPCPSDETRTAGKARLYPGRYALTVQQTESERAAPTVVRGFIHIACYANHWSGTGAFGWVDLDFNKLDASLGGNDRVPAPDSKDPDAPGFRVSVIGVDTVLFIGSLANIKPRTYLDPRRGLVTEAFMDGSGIVLYVDESEHAQFRGRWGPAGLTQSGRGVFVARLAEESATSR